MNILIFLLIGYAVLFYLLKQTGIDNAASETIMAFGELVPLLFLGVKFINWVFGTEFSESAWFYVWASLVGVWTMVAIWTLIDELRKRRVREARLRRILHGYEI